MSRFVAELRVASRALVKERAFTAVVVLTLALGIGTNTAIFSFVYGILLRPFDYPDPHQLVRVSSIFTKEAGREAGSSLLDVEDWGRAARHLVAIGAYTEFDTDVRGDGPAQPIRMNQLNAGALQALGVQPVLGRLFTADDDRSGGDVFQALISHGLWQGRYGGAPDVLGKVLDTSLGRFTIIGVMPRGFGFPDRGDAWAPMESWYARQVGERRNKLRHHRFYRVVARVAPGSSQTDAEAELTAIGASLERQFPKENDGVRVRVRSLRDASTGDLVPYLRMVTGAALFVLLICCFNVAGLLLTRALSSRREFAVRAALGASRARLLQAALAQSSVLAAVGGVLGVLLAWASVRGLLALIPVTLPTWMRIEVDPVALGFAVVVTILTALLCGLTSALFAARADLNTMLKEDTRTSTGGGARLRGLLVVSQVSMTLLLLIGASLLTQTFVRLHVSLPVTDAFRLAGHGREAYVQIAPTTGPGLLKSSRRYRRRCRAVPKSRALTAVELRPHDHEPRSTRSISWTHLFSDPADDYRRGALTSRRRRAWEAAPSRTHW